MTNHMFRRKPSFSSFGYFFVPGPLGSLKFVPEEVLRSTDSIDNVSINICRESKNEIFLMDKYRQFSQKWQSFKVDFFRKFMPPGNMACRKTALGMISVSK